MRGSFAARNQQLTKTSLEETSKIVQQNKQTHSDSRTH